MAKLLVMDAIDDNTLIESINDFEFNSLALQNLKQICI